MPISLYGHTSSKKVRPQPHPHDAFRKWQAKRRKYKLEQEHVDFITSQDTLVQQAGLSLAQRAKAFHRRFPDRRTYPVAIKRLYKAKGISKKKV